MKPSRPSSRYLLLALIIALGAHGCLLLWRGVMARQVAAPEQLTVRLRQSSVAAGRKTMEAPAPEQAAVQSTVPNTSPAVTPTLSVPPASKTNPNSTKSVQQTATPGRLASPGPDEAKRESGGATPSQAATQAPVTAQTLPSSPSTAGPATSSAGSRRCDSGQEANCTHASPGLISATDGTSSATQAIRILQAPKPVMPESARQRGEEGVVTLRIHVTAQGVADEVRVQQSSGSRRLDDAARTTVQQQWRFGPAERNGSKIAAETIQQIEFHLSD